MKCPQCQSFIKYFEIKDQLACQECRHLFLDEQKWQLKHYFSLRSQREQARQVEHKVQSQIHSITREMNTIERVFTPLEPVLPKKVLTDTSDTNQSDLNQKESSSLSLSHAETTSYSTSETQNPSMRPKQKIKPPFEIRLKNPFDHVDFQWEKLLGFNLLLIIGVIFVLIGVTFFIRKVFVSGYLGPLGKLCFIYFGALLTLGVGNFFRQKWKDFGLIIMGLAVVLLYYATFAGFHNYKLMPQMVAFGLMALITVFTVALSLMEDNKGLAILALCGGFSSPLMLQGGSGDFWALNFYICILNAGFLILALKKQWHVLYYLGFVFTYLLFIPSLDLTSFYPGLSFLNVYFLTYGLYPFFYHLTTRTSLEKSDKGPLSVIFMNAALATGMNYYWIIEHKYAIEFFALITLGYALLFLGLATFLHKKQEKTRSFHFMTGLAATFILITVPVIFSQQLITILWFALVYVLFRVSHKVENTKLFYGAIFLQILLGLKLLVYDYPFVFKMTEEVYILPHYTHLGLERGITMLFVLISSWLFARHHQSINHEKVGGKKWLIASWSIFSTLLFLVSNIETNAFAHDYLPQSDFVAISILWGFYAVLMIYIGLKNDLSALRKIGIGLFFMTFLKIFFIDMSQLEITYKFISFMVIGLFLIFTSYLYRHFKDQFQLEDNKDAG